MSLTQQEYTDLLKMDKIFGEQDDLKLGPHPIKWSRNINSVSTHDTFVLDFLRNSTIKVEKYQYNKRFRSTIVLLRYCSDKPHTNPDGKKFPGAHLHIYQEGFDDKVAFEPSSIGIDPTSDDMETVLIKILKYFNVNNIPNIQRTI